MDRVAVVSRVAAPAPAVWRRVTTADGVNHELMPVLRMTVPAMLGALTLDGVEPGTRVGRSYLLLFGLLPVDYDDIVIAEVEHGPRFRFLETSTMLSMSAWRHERTVTAVDDGCEVRDDLSFALRSPLARVPGGRSVAAAIVRALFRHRHRRLVAYFG